jgi:hypothetical protein
LPKRMSLISSSTVFKAITLLAGDLIKGAIVPKIDAKND